MRRLFRTLLLGALVAVQGCTIAYNDLHGQLPEQSDNLADCRIRFALQLVSGHHTNTFGVRESDAAQAKKLTMRYAEDTETALNGVGCEAEYVTSASDADLAIRVERIPHISALAQEWLTGLSFGLIPSWGTRESQYRYTFTDHRDDTQQPYVVDTHSYNHLFLFPVFWVTFFTADESRTYRQAVANFVRRA